MLGVGRLIWGRYVVNDGAVFPYMPFGCDAPEPKYVGDGLCDSGPNYNKFNCLCVASPRVCL